MKAIGTTLAGFRTTSAPTKNFSSVFMEADPRSPKSMAAMDLFVNHPTWVRGRHFKKEHSSDRAQYYQEEW